MAPRNETTYAVANITPTTSALDAVVGLFEALAKRAGYDPRVHFGEEIDNARRLIGEITKSAVGVHNSSYTAKPAPAKEPATGA